MTTYDNNDLLLSRRQVAERFGISMRFLEIAAVKGGGPVMVKVGLGDLIAETGRRQAAGKTVRVPDIPADAEKTMELLKDLHGSDTPAAFAEALHQASPRFYGKAGGGAVTQPGFTAVATCPWIFPFTGPSP